MEFHREAERLDLQVNRHRAGKSAPISDGYNEHRFERYLSTSVSAKPITGSYRVLRALGASHDRLQDDGIDRQTYRQRIFNWSAPSDWGRS